MYIKGRYISIRELFVVFTLSPNRTHTTFNHKAMEFNSHSIIFFCRMFWFLSALFLTLSSEYICFEWCCYREKLEWKNNLYGESFSTEKRSRSLKNKCLLVCWQFSEEPKKLPKKFYVPYQNTYNRINKCHIESIFGKWNKKCDFSTRKNFFPIHKLLSCQFYDFQNFS